MSSSLRGTASLLAGLRRLTCEAAAPWGAARAFRAGALLSSEAAAPATGAKPSEPADAAAEDVAAIEAFRKSRNFRRRADGRVLLQGPTSGKWMEAKLDGYVEGSLLLLAPDHGVHYLVSEDLRQIDLSNDQLVGQLFGEGGWEALMQPLYTQTAEGALKHVRMSPDQFRAIFTVLKEAPPPDDGGGFTTAAGTGPPS
ncbi:hypothetical protein HYH02_010933 [Chlamydomonas schloesseri]|uniref:Uncharacterized protein n=1 Tax=Chlamydomonas schloesseri TaxID=2026947 RepID=A0A835T3F2_9CHLO|nr:hypothetical protein HYH02_010933 [Chlamydomonas schloesseri]|eukprot:KAG2438232.1 hypothetical protein HYH02_010933 [Chlamydomonas schloesseri]